MNGRGRMDRRGIEQCAATPLAAEKPGRRPASRAIIGVDIFLFRVPFSTLQSAVTTAFGARPVCQNFQYTYLHKRDPRPRRAHPPCVGRMPVIYAGAGRRTRRQGAGDGDGALGVGPEIRRGAGRVQGGAREGDPPLLTGSNLNLVVSCFPLVFLLFLS